MELLTPMSITLDKGIDVFLEIEVQGVLFRSKKVPDSLSLSLRHHQIWILQDRLVEVVEQIVQKWLPNESKRPRKKLPSCVSMITIVNDQVPLAADCVSNVWLKQHFCVDRVIGHYQEMLPKSPTTLEKI